MKCCWVFTIAMVLLFTGPAAFAQQQVSVGSKDDAFWIAYWESPRLFFGSEEEAFYKNMKEVMFPWNNHDEPSNPGVLDENVQWLKDHPNVRFYVDGYASSRGELIYNLNLSQRRAQWVKQALVSRGISDNRIVLAVGWGQLYPVCPELNDECWSRNKLVRFIYSPI
jgi:outer membrane protein OmpA-like peptidoglycan-associated protein